MLTRLLAACEAWLLRQITLALSGMKPGASLAVQTLYSIHRAREGRGILPEVPMAMASSQARLLSFLAPRAASDHPALIPTLLPLQVLYDEQYPINALRNVAIDACRSHLLACVDVDFIPSRGLHGALRNAVHAYLGADAAVPGNALAAPVAQSLALADQLREGLALVVRLEGFALDLSTHRCAAVDLTWRAGTELRDAGGGGCH